MHEMFAGLLPRQFVMPLPVDAAGEARLAAFLKIHATEIAGIVVEPLVQGAGGKRFHDGETLRRLRRLADAHDLLLIFDEIFTGFGRTGSLFACEQAGVVPDILTLSKGLTGGTMALAATVARSRVFDAFWDDDPRKALMHGPTFTGNPLACAAANASLDLFAREPRLNQVQAIADQMRTELAPCRRFAGVRDVRVMGAIGVVEMEAIADLDALRARFIEQGVFLRPFSNVIYLTPAFTIAPDDLSRLTGAIATVIAE
jgi:adenosylmethionine-8-amino-7-oxononanoate aminotransferase